MARHIVDIKNPWLRRSYLCTSIVPAVVLHIVIEATGKVTEILKDAKVIFKEVWKGA